MRACTSPIVSPPRETQIGEVVAPPALDEVGVLLADVLDRAPIEVAVVELVEALLDDQLEAAFRRDHLRRVPRPRGRAAVEHGRLVRRERVRHRRRLTPPTLGELVVDATLRPPGGVALSFGVTQQQKARRHGESSRKASIARRDANSSFWALRVGSQR